MQLSEIVEWGLHSCLALAMLPRGTRMPARYLAEYHGLKPAYLSKTMHKLVASKIVTSAEGRNGGLSLARPADQISVLEIVQALDGKEHFFRCSEIRQQGPCAAGKGSYIFPCTIAQTMHKADAAWRRVLAETTLADLKATAEARPIEGVGEATRVWLEHTGAVREGGL
jgi:Rrf2 family protein